MYTIYTGIIHYIKEFVNIKNEKIPPGAGIFEQKAKRRGVLREELLWFVRGFCACGNGKIFASLFEGGGIFARK